MLVFLSRTWFLWWAVLAIFALRLFHRAVVPWKETERTAYEADHPQG